MFSLKSSISTKSLAYLNQLTDSSSSSSSSSSNSSLSLSTSISSSLDDFLESSSQTDLLNLHVPKKKKIIRNQKIVEIFILKQLLAMKILIKYR